MLYHQTNVMGLSYFIGDTFVLAMSSCVFQTVGYVHEHCHISNSWS